MKLSIFSKNLLAFSAAMALAAFAHATQPGNNGGGNGGCGVGQQTNGCGGAGGAGGAGGSGGQGGNGGKGVGIGVGIANAASSATAHGGNGGAGGTGYGGIGVGGNSGGNNLNNSVTVEGDKGDIYVAPVQERAPVATAYAAPLVSSNGTCMGSSSAGGQGAAIGITIGTTWTDNNCDIRYDAEALRAAGLNGAAQARLCQKKEIKEAMESAGLTCPNKSAERRAEAILSGSAVATNSVGLTGGGQGNGAYVDPIIRARLGLPPLK